MKSIIKKWSITLFLSLLIWTPCLSQNISTDSLRRKALTIICAEHEKLSTENPLLLSKIQSLEELNKLYISQDSLRLEEVKYMKLEKIKDTEEINKLKKSKNTLIKTSIFGSIISFILGALLL